MRGTGPHGEGRSLGTSVTHQHYGRQDGALLMEARGMRTGVKAGLRQNAAPLKETGCKLIEESMVNFYMLEPLNVPKILELHL